MSHPCSSIRGSDMLAAMTSSPPRSRYCLVALGPHQNGLPWMHTLVQQGGALEAPSTRPTILRYQIIVSLASEELRKSSSPTSSASGRLSKLRECKVFRYVTAHPEGAAALTSKYLEDVKPPRKFSPHTHSCNSRKRARSTDRRGPPNRGSGREMQGMGSRTLTKSPPSRREGVGLAKGN